MKHTNQLPTQQYLLSILEYKDGELYWKIKPKHSKIKIGDIAGCITTEEYRQITIDKIRYYAHNLIWKMLTGNDPQFEIDHLDHERSNNKIENLCDTNENAKNQSKRKHNTSGVTGVDFDKSVNRWRVKIQNNNVIYIKRFDTKMEAEFHALEKYKEFGFHENHGS